jgi:8-oxo-dGTP diphosphatase
MRMAPWRSGYAEVCKTFYTGSIPVGASTFMTLPTKQLAGCVIKSRDGDILLLHRNTDTHVHWELPGGKLEKNESPEEAATREAREELGIDVSIINKIGEKGFNDSQVHWNYHWFSVEIISGKPVVMEPEIFDDLSYFDIHRGKMHPQKFSVNVRNLVDFLIAK